MGTEDEPSAQDLRDRADRLRECARRNEVHTLAVGDHIDTAEARWRVTEIHPGQRGYVILEAS